MYDIQITSLSELSLRVALLNTLTVLLNLNVVLSPTAGKETDKHLIHQFAVDTAPAVTEVSTYPGAPYISPPTHKSPPMPAPPVTFNAPVLVDVAVTKEVIVIAFDVAAPLSVTACSVSVVSMLTMPTPDEGVTTMPEPVVILLTP